MRTLISGVRLFDGERVVPTADVLVEDGVIAAPSAGDADIVIPGEGRTLLPGLIDSHVHVFDGDLSRALRHGVTTELDMFCLPANLARQRRVAAARDDVADLRSSGTLATAPGGHPAQLINPELADVLGDAVGEFDTVASVDDVAGFVAARVAEGADYLKVVVERGSGQAALAPEVIAALVSAGHEAGLTAIAHALSAEELRIALDAGVDGIAHVFYDVPPGPDLTLLIARILAREVFFVSTLAYIEKIAPDRSADAGAAAGALHRAGVPLLAGTDANLWAPTHGDAMHRELELLVAAGLSPTAALASATSAPARVFGLADRGRVAPGLRADLLLVEGDATADITATTSIAGVWRRGVRL
ncbi:amidohydrolase family protein [Phytomonospora endophytica]|uniref:Imidazolonepropionase-like amidohydrolase n=1 Tax=Phytomonospora endophytica TaxID=714109 RepID=A0A841FP10_9ACTN|nr:amidohydrolase family protein [Phytomonospora endophytica]MBB6037564.1 imidazolonepropionase-like amidohydrolase [Phytomonospora endophytica]GIG70265.1 amidohydrolase [Phytomonospora endophytica]